MRLWLAHRAWNLFCDLQGDCLGRHGTFLSCDFELPMTRLSSAVCLGSMDSFRPSSDTSSSSAQTLGLGLNELKPVEPSGPTILIKKKKNLGGWGDCPKVRGVALSLIEFIILVYWVSSCSKQVYSWSGFHKRIPESWGHNNGRQTC